MLLALMDSDATVVRRGPGPKDKFGKPTVVDLSRVTYRARIEQVGSLEGEDFVVNRWRAYFTGDADIHSGDVVECRGLTLEVDGAASLRQIPGYPILTHVVANLIYREG